MSDIKLLDTCLPCPFCGSKPEGMQINDSAYIQCSSRDCTIRPSFPDSMMLDPHTLGDCIQRWNTRFWASYDASDFQKLFIT